MAFEPHNTSHAVISATFVLRYKEPVGVEAVRESSFPPTTAWSEELPGRRGVQGLSFEIRLDGAEQRSNVVGTQFIHAQPDGSPAWLLRIAADHVAVECHVYTRWAQVWSKARRYLEAAIAHLKKNSPQLDVGQFELQVVDRFYSSGKSYDLSELLNKSSVVPEAIFDEGLAWHSHCGWYHQSNDLRVLHNINVDAAPHPIVQDPALAEGWQVVILHFQRAHLEASKNSTASGRLSKRMVQVVERLHQSNKQMLGTLLTQRYQAKIALNNGAKS